MRRLQRHALLIFNLSVFGMLAPLGAAAEKLQLDGLQRLDALTLDLSDLRPKIIMMFEPNCRFCGLQRKQMELLQQNCPAVEQWLVGINGTERALKQQWQAWQSKLPLFTANAAWLRYIGGVDATPTTLFISAEQQVLAKHRGMLNQAQLLKAYQALSEASCVFPN